LPDDHWNVGDNVKNTEDEMAPSDSKDDNINMYRPSKLKSKEVSNRKNTKLMAKYGLCAKTGVYCEVAEAPRHEARDIE